MISIEPLEADFLYGERYRHYVIPWEKIDVLAPSCPGIYSWHIRIKPNQEETVGGFLDELFCQQKLKAEVKGNLRLKYSGDLTKKYESPELDDYDLIKQALVAFSLPLYIGISGDLKIRLSTHKNTLKDVVGSSGSELLIVGDVKEDSYEESVSFGQRLGDFWLSKKFHTLNCLFVKYIVPTVCQECVKERCEEVCRKKWIGPLKDTETMLNNYFNPVWGRR